MQMLFYVLVPYIPSMTKIILNNDCLDNTGLPKTKAHPK